MTKIYQKHIPVLLQESIHSLNIKKNGIYIDCTFGEGGHTKKILKKLGKNGKLYSIDRDPYAISEANKIKDHRFCIIQGLFSNILNYAKQKNIIGKINGIILDLGMSSLQLNNPTRGFSFMQDGPLDMRMNPKKGISAASWLNKAKENEIAFILKKFGEEKFAKHIAKSIFKQKKIKPILRTKELADLIAKSIPKYNKFKHPATRSFQAIRIYLNQEIEEINLVLNNALKILIPGGRLSIISFHSLEDRIVKKFIKKNSQKAQVPIGLPITEKKINQIKKIKLKIINRIFPSENEIYINPKSRSSILRVAEKSKE
ncbi:16S rRNA (cytosine(1402)-N(4))-methyltransferase RsmH [Buchnera aphidicola (Pemphigus obesinymphae)]|uniref:16S rRNA (cytosine(1402)-N(4))-methyltransferase RsmH n=1 Tax=Buchnera aphidicola TaxID=9 RepID=UPI0022377080|nr:16S rRNA (cytosine(1402)-N(4))-methyltransferase RsmH [Buchnera aphidicola]MCW5196464.1 16S rRNA (cytosine(1402)-N(4))-methyltransferase RsmH [Buchnera aphidicola (Pemphigus obesinymphae)]